MYKFIKNQFYNLQHTNVAILETRDSYIYCYIFSCLHNYSNYKLQGCWYVPCHGFLAGEVVDTKKAISTLTKLLNIVEKALDSRIKQVIWHVPYTFLHFIEMAHDLPINNKVALKDINNLKDHNFYNDKIPRNYFLLNETFSNYYVDNTEYINPIGLYAKTLSINANLTMVEIPYIKTIYQLLDYFSLDMIFASNLLLYLPYLFYNKSNNVDAFIDIGWHTSRIIVFNKYTVKNFKQLNSGVGSIMTEIARGLNLPPEILGQIHLGGDSFLQIQGKNINLEYNNKVYSILYDDFSKSLEEVLSSFMVDLQQELTRLNFGNLKNINFIGECSNFLINNTFKNYITTNNSLQKIIIKENENSNINIMLEYITSFGFMKFLEQQVKHKNTLSIFNKKIEQLIRGEED